MMYNSKTHKICAVYIYIHHTHNIICQHFVRDIANVNYSNLCILPSYKSLKVFILTKTRVNKLHPQSIRAYQYK